MAFDTVSSLVHAVARSGLLDAVQCKELETKLQKKFTEPWSLAEYLVNWGWLTIYQIQQLAKGRHKPLVVGPYHILDRLGEGGVSRVYKARHKDDRTIVALKIIHPELLHSAETVGRFRREMQAITKMSHPNIVRAFDVCETGHSLYYAMEYVAGIDLNKKVGLAGALPVSEACEYTRQAALGLQHVHEHGLVHRDIKPANLFVTQPGEVVKVLDLGLARLRRANEEETGEPLTREGIMIGSPDYLAPEQALDPRNVDIRADIYSLGCTFYYLLTGQPPFPGGKLLDKLRRHQVAEPTRADIVRPGLKESLSAIHVKMMAKRPDDRYRVPAEVAKALTPFCRKK